MVDVHYNFGAGLFARIINAVQYSLVDSLLQKMRKYFNLDLIFLSLTFFLIYSLQQRKRREKKKD